jgi:hypothetical protein
MPATARPYPAGPQTPGSRLGSLPRNRLSGGGLSEAITGPGMSMATKDTHPAVMADNGSPFRPGLALAPVSSLTGLDGARSAAVCAAATSQRSHAV